MQKEITSNRFKEEYKYKDTKSILSFFSLNTDLGNYFFFLETLIKRLNLENQITLNEISIDCQMI